MPYATRKQLRLFENHTAPRCIDIIRHYREYCVLHGHALQLYCMGPWGQKSESECETLLRPATLTNSTYKKYTQKNTTQKPKNDTSSVRCKGWCHAESIVCACITDYILYCVLFKIIKIIYIYEHKHTLYMTEVRTCILIPGN